MEKIDILVTNDDGVTAPGIKELVDIAKEFGNVLVVAPDSPQSGKGHGITIENPIRFDEIDPLSPEILTYQCSGTPVDCVKIAVSEILNSKPDLILSGINHGHNAAISVLYSGTVSAAMEGAIEKVPSIAFSLDDFGLDADFSAVKFHALSIIKNVLKFGMPEGIMLNVNFPAVPEIKGVKVTHHGFASWEQQFEKRKDPAGREYYWLCGKFKPWGSTVGTDMEAMEQGYASITPLFFDLTAHKFVQDFKNWEF